MTPKSPKTSVSTPALLAAISQESAVGKTTLITVLADYLTLKRHSFSAFQADDKPRLSDMLGAKVVDLKPDADLLMEQPSLLRTAYSPLYTACSSAKSLGQSVLLDGGAREVENLCGFFADVGLDEDLVAWNLPMVIFILVQADPESVSAAVMTWKRLKAVLPSAKMVLVENVHDRGRIEKLKPTSPARRLFENDLAPLVAGAPRIIMPAIVTDFWVPFEESGTRFLKVMAMEAREGGETFSMSTGDFKIARGNVTRFFQTMQSQFDALLTVREGGPKDE
ncbi:hypothetical protein [Pelagibacterium luteolum]|uniref:CobQ/CobB/MinD/ParA nucleotide binding domain-containing protein n=1 Tax=Pelagibacterium luteolum TaxID=440168 RepID=A0A1G8AUL3_9HYPH|nr:hypothetical protein [Pelagibacterium luteolum]SDH24456.1 hypothetical protein SAMN04487974_1412 [Pelagibacterium luteolum]